MKKETILRDYDQAIAHLGKRDKITLIEAMGKAKNGTLKPSEETVE